MHEHDVIQRLRRTVSLLKNCAYSAQRESQGSADQSKLREVVEKLRGQYKLTKLGRTADRESLRSVLEKICTAALEEFNQYRRPGFVRLHQALTTDGLPLAALSVCGRGTVEIRYTQLLRYFLDPKSPHGLGSQVLRATLRDRTEAVSTSIVNMDFDSARVFAEVPLGKVEDTGNTLDLLIESNGQYVFIEHKINSREAGSESKPETLQTKRYSKAIRDNWPMIRNFCRLRSDCPPPNDTCSLKLFLTPNGTKPADSEWQSIRHEEIIQACLSIFQDKRIKGRARHNLCCFLWDLMVGPVLQDESVVDELRDRVETLYADILRGTNRGPSQWFALEQWCDNNNIDWKTIITILEADNG